MDAFFASVEQRDHPELKGKPVIVGGDPKSRGVVAACSYEARKYGIHSAMSCSRAYKLCPAATFLRPRFDAYREVSLQIREIFLEYTDLVEPLSLDEAYLDVTENKKDIKSATIIAEEIRAKILERTNLTASAGVSFNKFIAKVASDVNKPNGITVITPDMADAFIEQLPIGKFFGIGKVTEKKMIDLGIKTGADLKRIEKNELYKMFGKHGLYYFDIAHGRDNRRVNPHSERKSIGKETTLHEDITDTDEIFSILQNISLRVEDEMKRKDVMGKTVTLKIKYFDFKSITRSVTVDQPLQSSKDIMSHIPALLEKTEAGQKKVRLLGITVSNFYGDEKGSMIQLELPFGEG